MATRVEHQMQLQWKQCYVQSTGNKWKDMEVDCHLQTSIMTGLVDNCDASNYLHYQLEKKEISQILVCRAKSREERLDLKTLVQSNVSLADNVGTYAIVGIVYGIETYWVVSLEVEENDAESKSFLSTFVDKLSIALQGTNQDLDRFKQQQMFQEKNPELINRLKFRLYADLQSNSIPDCGFYDFCFHQIKKTDVETNRIVPISVLLCPITVIIDPAQRFVANYRDVNADLLPRYCSIFDELGEIVAETKDFCWGKKGADRLCLLQFEKIVVEFKELLRNSLKIAVLKVRATQIASKEAENAIRIAENHPHFSPPKLEQWLDYKKSELSLISSLGSRGFNLVSKCRIQNELLQADFSLVLKIPSPDQVTSNILLAMKNYVDTNTKIQPMADIIEQIPWHKLRQKKVEILNEILTFGHHIEKNKHLEDQVQFFIAFSGDGECSYSVYQSDNLLKNNIRKLLEPPTGLRIYLPATRGTKRSKVSASNFRVEWNFEGIGYPCPFLVQFRPKGVSDWEEKTTEPDETEIELNFEIGLTMQVRVAAKTVIGQTEFSEMIDTEVASYTETDKRKRTRIAEMNVGEGNFADETFLQPPTELDAELVSRTAAKLQWNGPVHKLRRFVYIVRYCRNGQDFSSAEELDVDSAENSCILENLEPETTYCVNIVAVSILGEETSLPSKTILLTTGKQIGFPETILQQFHKITNSQCTQLDLYAVPLAEDTADRFVYGAAGRKQHKTIVVMGSAYSGKTMLINALINYVFNVDWDDNFRFQLIQEHPATTRVTVYDIHHADGFRIPYSLTIVDISGYGQVRNMSSNRRVNAAIRQLLMDNGVESIQEVDMVVIVVQASEPCPEVVLMFDLVRSVFDGDVTDNVSYFFTSADSQEPPMLNAIKGSNLPCPVDAETGQPIYYKFDSAAFFGWNRKSSPNNSSKDVRSVQLNRLLMSMGMENFRRFFSSLSTVNTKLYCR